MNDDEIRRARDRALRWKRDPVEMVRDLFHVEPDAWQAEALRAFAAPYATDPKMQRIALQACAGPGKSTVLAWCGWNFLVCYDSADGHPNGAAMSVTGENLKNNLWKELAFWRDRSPFLVAAFEMTSESIFARDFPKTWFLSARTWSKTADAEAQGRTLSGLHARSILYLIDEAGEIAPSVGRSAEQGLSNCHWGKLVIDGNPTSHEGMLYQAVVDQSHRWHVIRVTGDPNDPKRSPRIGMEWAQQQITQYGRDNPWVMAYVLGQFPPTSINALLGPDEVRAAMQRHVRDDQFGFSQKRLGVDVARFGDDATVIFPRQGLCAFEPVTMRNARTHEIAARIAQAKARWGSEMELIDDTGGYGAGVIDSCLLGGISLIPVNFSGKADDPRYFNKRSEMHFRAAEWVKNGGALPNIPALVGQAVAPTFWYEGGRLRVLEKDQIKKQIGRSPDEWDAFVVTFALADQPANVGALVGAGQTNAGKLLSDYDPFQEGRW